jgi:2-(1,2-epoxy-1,2-dihydrophenyl)acetyl-CoA isomerase
MSESSTIVEQYGHVLHVAMTSLSNRNALDDQMKEALTAASEQFVADPELRCLVITGSDNIFCAGGDLRNMANDRRPPAVRQRVAKTHRLLKLLNNCEKPVITAVNGAAIGAGMALALSGDIVVAADEAFFVSGFPKVGVLPDTGILYSLPRAVGMAQAKDILMTNRRIDAQEALNIGMISRVLPQAEFDARVRELAVQVANGPTVAFGLAKSILNSSHRDNLDDLLAKESLGQVVAFGSDDFAEGVLAFQERRNPEFKGK